MRPLSRRPGRVPVDTGTASVSAGLDQAALTSIVLGVTACGAGTLTSSMPFVYFASTWAALTPRSEEHTSELQSQSNLVCRLLLEKKKKKKTNKYSTQN